MAKTMQRNFKAYKKGVLAAHDAKRRRVYLVPTNPYGYQNRDLMDSWVAGVEDYERNPEAALAMVCNV